MTNLLQVKFHDSAMAKKFQLIATLIAYYVYKVAEKYTSLPPALRFSTLTILPDLGLILIYLSMAFQALHVSSVLLYNDNLPTQNDIFMWKAVSRLAITSVQC